MRIGYIIGIVMLFGIFQLIAGIVEQVAPLSSTAISRLDILMNPQWTNITGYVNNLWSMFWFDYPFLQDSWQLVRYILFIPVSIGVIVVLILTVGQILVGAIGSVLRGIR